MSKTVLKNKDEFDAAMKNCIALYLSENPIYKKLNLTEEQLVTLVKEEIMPKFKEKFEFESKVMKQWFESGF